MRSFSFCNRSIAWGGISSCTRVVARSPLRRIGFAVKAAVMMSMPVHQDTCLR